MSWSELERFVDDVEADSALQRALKHCRSRKELILAARRLGYRITRIDLHVPGRRSSGNRRRRLRDEQSDRSQQAVSAVPSPSNGKAITGWPNDSKINLLRDAR